MSELTQADRERLAQLLTGPKSFNSYDVQHLVDLGLMEDRWPDYQITDKGRKELEK